MPHTLIISGHTDLNNSVANRHILETLEGGESQFEIVRLDTLYTHRPIAVSTEQDRLRGADIIVFQFPLFWYTAPSLLHRWIEETFLHGFSHGSQGQALHGKCLLLSFTTGAPAEYYTPEGQETPDFNFLYHPFLLMCRLTGMEFCGAEYTNGVSYALRNNPQQLKQIREKAEAHAHRLIHKIKELA